MSHDTSQLSGNKKLQSDISQLGKKILSTVIHISYILYLIPNFNRNLKKELIHHHLL